jgi:UDP-glucose 4-epimerase
MPLREPIAVLGAGFIGLNLIRRLVASGAEVTVLDHNEAPRDLALGQAWVRGEFNDPAAISRVLRGARVAFHLLSSTVPGDEHVDVTRELSDNIFATLGFLDTCLEVGVRRVVFASSSSVYGLQRKIPIAETAPTDPISSHGIQKLAIEKYLQLYRFNHGLDIRIARLSNPFGPGQKLYGRQGFVALTIGHLLKDEPILLRDEGRPIRDFIYIDDVVESLYQLAFSADTPWLLNVGAGSGHSLQEVVRLVEELIGRPIRAKYGEPRRADIPVSVLDVTLATRSLGHAAKVSLRDGLERTLRYYGIETPGAAAS